MFFKNPLKNEDVFAVIANGREDNSRHFKRVNMKNDKSHSATKYQDVTIIGIEDKASDVILKMRNLHHQ